MGGSAPDWSHNSPLNWKLRFPSVYFGILMPLKKKKSYHKSTPCQEKDNIFRRGDWPRLSRGNWLFLQDGGKKDYVWLAGDLLGHPLVLPCPVIKANRKLQQSKGTDPSGIKVWVTPSGKEPRSDEMLANDKGNTEWVVEKGSYKYQLISWDQFQKWGL